ncbi:hypothetical protein VNO80_07610 [Phaseolus coccineus]|uniref:RING-type domain-containing protein n=1 Tax=Phaseolus coccineus TaxID=3886 RepID=A0AAN9NQX3_PHACN
MTTAFQQSTFSYAGIYTSCNDKVNITIVIESSDPMDAHCGVEKDYYYVFAALFKGRYFYNIVNTTGFLDDEHVQSKEYVRNLAYQGGQQSLPAGAATLEKLRICFICREKFNCGDDGARLPCSHICHYDCIIQWFVHSGTCPLCRFTCSRDS